MKQSNSPSFSTKRLRLRYITEEDAEDIFYYAKNSNVTRYTAFDTHKTLKDALDFVRSSRALNIRDPLNPFGIFIQSEGREKMIGTVGLFKGKLCRENTLELGYALGEDWWGKGYGIEASQVLINHAFKTLNIRRIEALCIKENIGSFRVMEKLGMQREGLLRKHLIKNGYIYDMYIYSLLKEEWEVFK
ncbi:GNAT family N-acetyltransferase [Fluviispira multicolorata]|uniref:GNAT family N-acetyltransferase n=1 Tax=Fluviispira multicolorata TaxID=2654512 RepID=A0A833JFB7_9BACT|nr:GNAT family protein [Fluviispira multicolorata]KAB8030955.1 GNAT family N-acetyltransferase [Fluviispira multicolorata]